MRIAFTGHRPHKLRGMHNEIIAGLTAKLIELNPSYAISGLATGVDMLAAAVCRMLLVPYEAAVPFLGQADRYSEEDLKAYIKLIDDATNVVIVCDGEYKPWFYQVRDEYMVDNCDLLLAVWDGSKGGTGNTVKYAQKVGRKILFLIGRRVVGLQTFLPYEDFQTSARALDYRRLGKQRVEVLQIYNTISNPDSRGWRSHPAVSMWRGHCWWLLAYGIEVCVEWKERGYNDSLLPKFLDFQDSMQIDQYPPWLGREDIHSSHRANLIRKDAIYYRSHGWVEDPIEGYVWP